ncbi:MAG: inorganic phosphate transporter [Methanomicrobiales archaeon]|nr:inorganic phosphate transporter [Methanomicrobiales archaeon]
MLAIAALALVLAFAFTFTNGFQNAGAMAATFITSRSASPRQGILLVSIMGFAGALLGGTAVALTIAGLLTLPPEDLLIWIVLLALLSAALWNLMTWRYGMPTSSTHGLIGGLIGAGVASAGIGSIDWGVEELLSSDPHLAGVVKVVFFLVLTVLVGFIGGYALRVSTRLLLRNAPRKANRTLVGVNWAAAAAMAFTSGANDAQKQMGVIAIVLLASGISAGPTVPLWARFGCAVLLALGTLGGGWRVMATLGRRIFRIQPVHSLDSQVSSGAIIALATLAGAPVSTTHVISTSVIGVGAAENPLKVRWLVGTQILVTMLVTIPATACLAALLHLVLSPFLGI